MRAGYVPQNRDGQALPEKRKMMNVGGCLLWQHSDDPAESGTWSTVQQIERIRCHLEWQLQVKPSGKGPGHCLSQISAVIFAHTHWYN